MNFSVAKVGCIVLALLMCVTLLGCQKLPEAVEEIQNEEDLTAFLDRLERRYEDNCIKTGRASWKRITGSDDAAFNDVQNEFTQLMLNPVYRDIVYGWRFRGSNKVKDPDLRRRLVIWSRCFMGAEADDHPEIYALEQSLEEQSDQFHFTLNGESISRTELNRIIRTDPDSQKRRQAWEAFGQLSEEAKDDMRTLMVMRNRSAVLYGAPVGYGYLSMFVQSVELEWLLDILKTLEERTREPYRQMVASLQQAIDVKRLFPWDLQYGMHSLALLPDEYFPADQSIPMLKRFLANIGFSVDRLPIHITEDTAPFGPLGLTIEIPKDYRLIVDPEAGHRFYSTLFSEYGRGLYAVHIQAERPIYKAYTWVPGAYSPAYNDAMAEVLGEFTRDPYWLSQYTQIPESQLQQYALTRVGSDLYSIRSLMNMVSFELEAYKNPMQDLDSLEKALNRKFLLVDVPDDTVSRWASMSYLVTNPMYYQNYLLATLITAQVHQTLRETFGARLINDPKVARWLIDNLYAAGESLPWKERILRATGSDLTVDAFVKRFPTLSRYSQKGIL